MARYKCSAEMHDKCSNNALCHLCDGISLFNDPVQIRKDKLAVREQTKREEKTAIVKTYKKEKKEGMAFEKRVASSWNNKFSKTSKKKVAKPRLDMEIEEEDNSTPTVESKSTLDISALHKKTYAPPVEAVRQSNSGALWHSKGDIKLEHALLECKERGTVNARGQKQITIPKLWIEKQEQEAFQEKKDYWYIPFAYKGEDDIYLVKSFEHEMEMIYELRRIREENEKLKADIERIKNGG